MNKYWVYIPANVYSGKYHEYGMVLYRLEASSKANAANWVDSHKEQVIEELAKKRLWGPRRLVAHPAKDNIFFKPNASEYFVKQIKDISWK